MYVTAISTVWTTVREAIAGWPQTVRLIIIMVVITICYLAAMTIR